MNDYEPTPRMTNHARARCQEMGITTKVAKAIVRNRSVTYGSGPQHGNPDALLAHSDRHPGLTVVFVIDDGIPVVLSVLYRTQERYVRAEKAHG